MSIADTIRNATDAEIERLAAMAAFADFYMGEDCEQDHHGYCQAHGLSENCDVGPYRETTLRDAINQWDEERLSGSTP